MNHERIVNLATITYWHFYIYFIIALIISFFLIHKIKSNHKVELFFISFFLMTGELNRLLTIEIPGFSSFEIQPVRFLLIMLSIFIVRNIIFSKDKINFTLNRKITWFEVVLYAYFILYIISQFANLSVLGLPNIIVNVSNDLTFLFIIYAFRLMPRKETNDVIGRSILIGAGFSSFISIIQIAIDSSFLRIGTNNLAFGNTIRANGIFFQEHYNSYFIMTGIIWAIVMLKNKRYKIILIGLYSVGVILTFHRMSWLILTSILTIYLIFLEKVALDKLILGGLSFIAVLLTIFIFYFDDVMNSALVKERLTEDIGGRKGYYTMVFENIHKKPLFGYGNRDNEVYYSSMLKITESRGRATGTEGGIHNGYLTALFFSGIPVFLCFTLFALFSFLYYAKLVTIDFVFAIPFFMSFIFLVGNLTNSLLFSKFIGILYAIHLGIAIRTKYEIDTSPIQNYTGRN